MSYVYSEGDEIHGSHETSGECRTRLRRGWPFVKVRPRCSPAEATENEGSGEDWDCM